METAQTLMHAFVSSKLDNCNALLCGIRSSACNTCRTLPLARLVILSRKHDHISPVLMVLHWLPVEQRVEFMILLFTCKVVNGIISPGSIGPL